MNRGYPLFPLDPTDEELARDWTLTSSDLIETRKCRGADNKHRFAIQLCALRTLGRFAGDYESVPVRVVNHIGTQLGLAATLFIKAPARPATDTGHVQRARAHLNYGTFDQAAQDRLRGVLIAHAMGGTTRQKLLSVALDTLRAARTEIPGITTLERVIGGCLSVGEQDATVRVNASLPEALRAAIDELLAVADTDRFSPLSHLKEDPPEARPGSILLFLARAEQLRALDLSSLDFGGVPAEALGKLAELGRRYDVREIRRFAPAKRYAVVACLLVETQKAVLDNIVEMHRTYLLTLNRHARRRLIEREHDTQRRARDGLSTVMSAMRSMMAEPSKRTMADVYAELGEERVRMAFAACMQLERLGERGLHDELRAGHSQLKRYLPGLLRLPFQAQAGAEKLLHAIEYARALHKGERQMGDDAPLDFTTKALRQAIVADGKIDARLWEVALAGAVRDALHAGDLYLAESRHHVSFWNLVHGPETWAEARETAYDDLSLPSNADEALGRLREDFVGAVRALVDGLAENSFVRSVDPSVVLTKEDAAEIPRSVRDLRRLLETRLPRIRVEDLLVEVDTWCGFTRELVAPDGYTARTENVYPALLAALVAHGTNLGIATMAQSTKGVTVDTLQHVTRWLMGADALKGASRVLVDYHHKLPISETWGDGHTSSSDGQRFGVQRSTLLASFYPRYFGYYDRAITVYTHQADQWSVYGQRVISCAAREASYVLDGLLENDTLLEIREHHTDTHGATEHIFGLCYLLGYAFMPRFKDIGDQKLYKFEREIPCGRIEPIFDGAIELGIIREQWDALVRIAASLRSRTSPAHVVITRLAASSDRLAKALQALGRLLKTIHILRYLHDGRIRARIQLQLNRGESRHDLARRLFFANRGVFRTGDYAEIMNKVSALSVLSNAVLVWNTVRIGGIVDELRAAGQTVDSADLARVSPLLDAHIIATGSYHFERAIRRARSTTVPSAELPAS